MSKEVQETIEKKPFVGIDWCSDTETGFPDSDDRGQFITVQRFTAKQRRQRTTLGGRMRIGGTAGQDFEYVVPMDALKDFEYVNGIIDFALRDSKGSLITFDRAHPDRNKKIYDHFTPEVEAFIDDLIAKVNKEEDLAVEDITEVEGNSESS